MHFQPQCSKGSVVTQAAYAWINRGASCKKCAPTGQALSVAPIGRGFMIDSWPSSERGIQAGAVIRFGPRLVSMACCPKFHMRTVESGSGVGLESLQPARSYTGTCICDTARRALGTRVDLPASHRVHLADWSISQLQGKEIEPSTLRLRWKPRKRSFRTAPQRPLSVRGVSFPHNRLGKCFRYESSCSNLNILRRDPWLDGCTC